MWGMQYWQRWISAPGGTTSRSEQNEVMSVDQPCDHCDHPDSSLLRVVLIGEIIRAEDSVLYSLASICERLGLMQVTDEDDGLGVPGFGKGARRNLRRVK